MPFWYDSWYGSDCQIMLERMVGDAFLYRRPTQAPEANRVALVGHADLFFHLSGEWLENIGSLALEVTDRSEAGSGGGEDHESDAVRRFGRFAVRRSPDLAGGREGD